MWFGFEVPVRKEMSRAKTFETKVEFSEDQQHGACPMHLLIIAGQTYGTISRLTVRSVRSLGLSQIGSAIALTEGLNLIQLDPVKFDPNI